MIARRQVSASLAGRARSIRRAACILTLLSCVGCDSLPGRPTAADRPTRPDQVLNFATLYGQNCAGCHGTETRPGGAVMLHDPVYLALVNDTALRSVIAGGVPGTAMPAFAASRGGTLTDAQIDVIVKEMRSRWSKADALAGAPAPPYAAEDGGEAARGSGVYSTYCASCHGNDGKGGPHGGSVVDGSFLALVSNQDLRTTVLVGRPALGMPDWRAYVPGRPMSAQDVSDVVAWMVAQRPEFPGQPYQH